jgi:hypothetical protein
MQAFLRLLGAKAIDKGRKKVYNERKKQGRGVSPARRITMQCSHCNRQIPDDSPFCPRCGAALAEGATVLQQEETPTRPRRERTPRRERAPRPERPRRERQPQPERPQRERPAFRLSLGTREPGTASIMRNFIYFSLATVCMIPQIAAEYMRIVMGREIDWVYWLLVAPILLTVFFVFLAIGIPELERKKMQDDAYFEQHGFHSSTSGMTDTVCRLLGKILIPIGIICILTSGLMWLIAAA